MAKVNRKNSSEPLREGDLVELECVAYNSKPSANITWFNGSELIEQLDSTASTPTLQTTPASSSASKWPQAQLTAPTTTTGTAAGTAHQLKQRHKRLLQRNQVHQNGDGQTFNTHSFLSIKLSRHEHRAQISCQAHNGVTMRQPLAKSIELQVQRKC